MLPSAASTLPWIPVSSATSRIAVCSAVSPSSMWPFGSDHSIRPRRSMRPISAATWCPCGPSMPSMTSPPADVSCTVRSRSGIARPRLGRRRRRTWRRRARRSRSATARCWTGFGRTCSAPTAAPPPAPSWFGLFAVRHPSDSSWHDHSLRPHSPVVTDVRCTIRLSERARTPLTDAELLAAAAVALNRHADVLRELGALFADAGPRAVSRRRHRARRACWAG